MKLMKALTYTQAHKLEDFRLELGEVPIPTPNDGDLLVQVRAFSFNPVDWKIRVSRNAKDGRPVILGWDAAGEVIAVGAGVQGFKVGDRVYYAGDLNRDGSYAEFQTVDHRIAAKMPTSLGFAQAAALPLTSLTAWEALFETLELDKKKAPRVLIWGGAGGVGSIAIQLLKARTNAFVIATSSRPESTQFVKALGADLVVDYRQNVEDQLKTAGMPNVDYVFGTTGSESAQKTIPLILKPFGHWIVIDSPDNINVSAFKVRSQTIHWELMFTKTIFHVNEVSQGAILKEVAALVDSGKIKTTLTRTLKGLTVENIRNAHQLLESGQSIGKTVLEI